MPTAIIIDTSLSMLQLIDPANTKLNYALKATSEFLDNIALYNKYESIALLTYSMSLDIIVPFTRKYELIKNGLNNLEPSNKSSLTIALEGVNEYISEEWGNHDLANILVITDGNINALKNEINKMTDGIPFLAYPLFLARLFIVVLTHPEDPNLLTSLPLYQDFIDLYGGLGKVMIPSLNSLSSSLTFKDFNVLFNEIINIFFIPNNYFLNLGRISCLANIYPNPLVLDSKQEDDSRLLDICGFVPFSDISNLPLASKHLVVPAKPSNEDSEPPLNNGKLASLCVLLHGSLKMENMAALCQLGTNHYGFLYSWAGENKKKSNLYLSLLHPGTNSVPWIGSLDQFSPIDAWRFELTPKPQTEENLPTSKVFEMELSKEGAPAKKGRLETSKIVVKRANHTGLLCFSYEGSAVKAKPNANYSLMQQYCLGNNDCQRLLRLARKITVPGAPYNAGKVESFYRELNRIRCLAMATGNFAILQHLVGLLAKEKMSAGDPVALAELTHAQNSIVAFDTYPHDAVIKPLMSSS